MVINYTRAIRDPVHSYIRLTDAESSLVDSSFLQRLRWISQLSGVRLVFPGAMHSRLAHALGVAHLSGEYAAQIYQEDDDCDYKIGLARLGGLLHDVGHGPFSHQYDDTVYRDIYPDNPHGHDEHRFKIIHHDLLRPYIEACGIDLKDLEELWKGSDPVLQAITQGALGADRMDFMLRDAYYSGTTHFGSIEVKRIISNALVVDFEGVPSLHYRLKLLEDIFQSLLGRFYMYRSVYFHKASNAADIIVRKMLDAAKDPLNLAERTKDPELYQWVNEYTLIGEIMSNTSPELEEARNYAKRLLSRDLPKLIWETTLRETEVKTISGDLEQDANTIANGQVIQKIKAEAKKRETDPPTLYVTNTYPMSTIDNQEFQIGRIFIYDEKSSLSPGRTSFTFREAIEKTAYFRSFLSSVPTSRERFVMIRVYSDRKDANWIREYLASIRVEKGSSIAETSY